jgi:hypothetical protein
MAKLQSGTRIYGTANVDTVLYVNSTAIVNTTGIYTTGLVNATSYNTGGGYGSATGGAVVNTTTIAVGNATVNLVINSSALSITVANASALGGYTFASPSTIGSTTANTGAFTSLSSANLTTSTNTVTIGTAAYHVANGNFGIANSVPIDKLAVAGTSYFNGNAVFNGVAAFYNINGQSNASAGAFVGNAYATLGGSSGNYLAFGQQLNSAQWIQSGYSSAGAPVYYSIILNPLGGNIGIANAAPSDRLSVTGTTYLQGNVTVASGNTTLVNVYSTGTVNAAAYTVGTSFIVNTTQVTISGLPLSANGSTGTATYVLTSNGSTGSPYWAAAASGSGGVNTAAQYTWSNTQTFSGDVNFTGTNTYFTSTAYVGGQIVIGAAGDIVLANGSGIQANGTWGTAGQALLTAGDGTDYWGNITASINTAAQYTWSNTQTFNANVTLTTPLIANGSPGTAAYVLTSNGATGAPYWAAASGGSSNGVSTGKAIAMAMIFGL